MVKVLSSSRASSLLQSSLSTDEASRLWCRVKACGLWIRTLNFLSDHTHGDISRSDVLPP